MINSIDVHDLLTSNRSHQTENHFSLSVDIDGGNVNTMSALVYLFRRSLLYFRCEHLHSDIIKIIS